MFARVLLGASLTIGLALGPALAGDGVPSVGRLSDRDFFRLATCGAAPGAECTTPTVRWNKTGLSVGLQKPHPGFPRALSRAASAALNDAIAEINRAATGLTLRRDDSLDAPDIMVTLSPLTEGGRTRDIPRIPDGEKVGVGFMRVWWDDRQTITEASFLITRDITEQDLPSVVLEELFQSLGFLHDIENPYYEGRSVLAQGSNSTIAITGQDRMILRRLYP